MKYPIAALSAVLAALAVGFFSLLILPDKAISGNDAAPSPAGDQPAAPTALPQPVLGRHCGGIGEGFPDDWCGCTWGAVFFQDNLQQPLEGVTVQIHFGGDYLEDVTAYGYAEDFPYYGESADRLGAHEGDVLTLVARWGDYQTSVQVVAMPDPETGEQRVDLIFPFPTPPVTPTPPPTPPPSNPAGWLLPDLDSTGSRFYPYASDHPISDDFTEIWHFSGDLHWWSPLTGDVNGDGRLELVLIDDNWLRVFAHDGTELWRRYIPGTDSYYNTGEARLPMLADVTGDGYPEIFVVRKVTDTEGAIYVYDGNGNLLPSWNGSTGTLPVAADGFLFTTGLLHNRRVIVHVGSNYFANPRGAAMVDAVTGSRLWDYRAGSGLTGSTADLDGDGVYEILSRWWVAVGNGSYGCGLGWNTCTDDGHLWVVMVDENGREVFSWQPPGHPTRGSLHNRIVDLNHDGHKEVLVAEGHWLPWHTGTSRLFLLDVGKQGVVTVTAAFTGPVNLLWGAGPIADTDADGHDELFLSGDKSTYVFDHNLLLVHYIPNIEPYAVNDINGDGHLDIIGFNTLDYRLVILGPELQPIWQSDIPLGPNGQGIIISDWTGDGVNDIIARTDTEIRVYAHQEEPLLPPPPLPTPMPTGGRTLILLSEKRLSAAYADDPLELAALHELTTTLPVLAAHSAVSGTIVSLDDDPMVAAAYAAWLPNPRSPVTDTTQCNVGANNVAEAIRSLIVAYVEQDPGYWNIVMLGDDRIIPFRRVADGSPPYFHEGTYSTILVSTTVGAAMAEDYILTDDYYGDLLPNGVPIPVAYIADHPVGRLVEKPSEMLALVQAFLARDGTIPVDNALVVGHDLVIDAALVERQALEDDGIPTDSLIGNGWTAADFRSGLLGTAHALSAINTHARHNAYAAADKTSLRAEELLAATYPLSGSVTFSPGCHAGLNLPPSYGPGQALDWPQAWAGRGIASIGNTGWGIGDRSGIAYSEALVAQLAVQLAYGDSATLGEALLSSKLGYLANKGFLDTIDEKVLLQFTLYGLPMYRLQTGAGMADAAKAAPAPSQDSMGTSDAGLTWVTAWYKPHEASFEQHTTPEGTYYTLDGDYHRSHNSPLEPRRYVAPEVNGGTLHGVVFRGGIYSDVVSYDPVVAAAAIITGGVPAEGIVSASNWFPAIPFQVLNLNPVADGHQESLAVQFGQFRPADQRYRLFSQMSFDLFYSGYDDFTPPAVTVTSRLWGGMVEVQAVATDTSGIHSAWVTFSAGDGHWRSVEMVHGPAEAPWKALLSPSTGLEYIVQVVDGAGNVGIGDNGGRYYTIPVFWRVGLPLLWRL